MPKLPLVYLALVAAMIVPTIVQARGKSTAAEERLIAGCIHRSARGKPWLEKALSALHDQEGGWIGAQVRNRDGSYDLGPMQINSWWVPRFAGLLGRSPVRVQQWLRQDACFNVEAARYILLNELDRSGHIWIAVGRYHSKMLWRQRRYVLTVFARLKSRFHATNKKGELPLALKRKLLAVASYKGPKRVNHAASNGHSAKPSAGFVDEALGDAQPPRPLAHRDARHSASATTAAFSALL